MSLTPLWIDAHGNLTQIPCGSPLVYKADEVRAVLTDYEARVEALTQERAMIQRRYADQCASVHRLMQENDQLRAQLASKEPV